MIKIHGFAQSMFFLCFSFRTVFLDDPAEGEICAYRSGKLVARSVLTHGKMAHRSLHLMVRFQLLISHNSSGYGAGGLNLYAGEKIVAINYLRDCLWILQRNFKLRMLAHQLLAFLLRVI